MAKSKAASQKPAADKPPAEKPAPVDPAALAEQPAEDPPNIYIEGKDAESGPAVDPPADELPPEVQLNEQGEILAMMIYAMGARNSGVTVKHRRHKARELAGEYFDAAE